MSWHARDEGGIRRIRIEAQKESLAKVPQVDTKSDSKPFPVQTLHQTDCETLLCYIIVQ